MPRTAVEEQLTIVHVHEIVDDLVLVAMGRVHDDQFLHQARVKYVGSQRREVCGVGPWPLLIRQVHLDVLLRVANLLAEQHESGQLTNHVGAD